MIVLIFNESNYIPITYVKQLHILYSFNQHDAPVARWWNRSPAGLQILMSSASVLALGKSSWFFMLTLKVLVSTIDAQLEGMGDVGSARYEPVLVPPCPTIRVLSYSNQ